MLCLDKTGTITTGKLEVVDVIGVNDTEKERVEAVMNEMAFAFDDVNNTQDALMKYFKKSSRWAFAGEDSFLLRPEIPGDPL